MPKDIRLGISLVVTKNEAKGELRVSEQAVDRFAKGLRRGGSAADRYGRAARQAARETRGLGRSFLDAHGHHLRYLAGFASVAGALQLGRGIIRHADQYIKISNAVRQASESTSEYVRVREELFRISQRTRTDYAATAELYQHLAISADELGASEQDLLTAVEATGQALTIYGADATSARGALRQLGQALGGSVVRAEEFNSILDAAKPLLTAVAANLDAAGGSTARLRRLVIEGKVSSQDFFRALVAGSQDLDRQFALMSTTIGQAMIQIGNSMTALAGRVDEASGLSERLAGALESLAESLADADAERVAGHIDLLATALEASEHAP